MDHWSQRWILLCCTLGWEPQTESCRIHPPYVHVYSCAGVYMPMFTCVCTCTFACYHVYPCMPSSILMCVFVRVLMCVFMSICVCSHVHVYICSHVFSYAHVCYHVFLLYSCVHVCVCDHMFMCIFMDVSVQMYMCSSVCTCECIHMHIYNSISMHT